MPDIPSTPQELVELIKSSQQVEIPIEEEDYQYVIYARKSTDNREQQVRSLGDQVIECAEFAKKNNFTVKAVIEESESAKDADIRPKFRQMLNDIKSGKYQGVIAWHPDRLARNMKEAGEIIDYLDKEIIKSLKFVNFSFQNDTAGKTLLGITFVLSKQFSDHLRDNIKRGIYRSIMEGKEIGWIPHGYIRDNDFFLWPDDNNFLVIKKAFQMRIDKRSLEEIRDYINNAGYSRVIKDGQHKLWKFTVQTVSTLLKKEIYAGVLKHGNSVMSLEDVYPFVPAISVGDFISINGLDKTGDKWVGANKGAVKAALLRGMIKCGYCKHNLSSTITHKYNKAKTKRRRYYYYRCDYCGKQKVRAYVVLNAIYKLLDEELLGNDNVYTHYSKEMEIEVKQRLRDADNHLKSLYHQEKTWMSKLKLALEYCGKETNPNTKRLFEEDLVEKQKKLDEIQEQIKNAKALKENPQQAVLDYNRFIELFKKAGIILRKTDDLVAKDSLLREIFSNLTMKGEEMTSYTLKPPFDRLVKEGVFRAGGDGRNRTAV